MGEVSGYQHGVPGRVDMGAPDLPGAIDFCTGQFGWDAEDTGPDTGHDTLMTKGAAALLRPAS